MLTLRVLLQLAPPIGYSYTDHSKTAPSIQLGGMVMKAYFFNGLLPLFLFACVFSVSAQVSLTAVDVAHTQNFDTLANTGTGNPWLDNTTLAGWYANRILYIASPGSSTTAGLHSLGATASTERALGSVASVSATPVLWGVRLQNNTGLQITSIDLSFVGEQWRDAATASQTLTFAYRVSDTPITDIATGTYTANTAFDFASPTFVNSGAIDGNAAANRLAINGTLVVALDPGDEIMLRWSDFDSPSADHGLAIDDFSVTPHATTTAANVSLSGRVVTSTGRGISNATVTMFGGNLPEPLLARTSAFGYYQFEGLAIGETYILSVGAKRYVFPKPTLIVTPTDNLDDLDFIAEP
jgi:hypothetical protein